MRRALLFAAAIALFCQISTAQSLPTTNLTWHSDASVVDDLWVNWQAGSPYHNTACSDTAGCESWEHSDTGGANDFTLRSSVDGTWQDAASVMQLPSLNFTGSSSYYETWDSPANAYEPVATWISATEWVFVVAVNVDAINTSSTTAWANDAILTDNGGNFGIYFWDRGAASDYEVYVYNWDGNADQAYCDISLDTDYVIVAWHESSTIYVEVHGDDSGTPVCSSSTASGNTPTGGGRIMSGLSGGGTGQYFDGAIGEIAIYDTEVAADRGNARDYFTSKWFPAAGSGSPVWYYTRQRSGE